MNHSANTGGGSAPTTRAYEMRLAAAAERRRAESDRREEALERGRAALAAAEAREEERRRRSSRQRRQQCVVGRRRSSPSCERHAESDGYGGSRAASHSPPRRRPSRDGYRLQQQQQPRPPLSARGGSSDTSKHTGGAITRYSTGGGGGDSQRPEVPSAGGAFGEGSVARHYARLYAGSGGATEAVAGQGERALHGAWRAAAAPAPTQPAANSPRYHLCDSLQGNISTPRHAVIAAASASTVAAPPTRSPAEYTLRELHAALQRGSYPLAALLAPAPSAGGARECADGGVGGDDSWAEVRRRVVRHYLAVLRSLPE